VRIKYTAKDISGRTVKGLVEAGNIKAAAGMLREQKMLPLELTELKKGLEFKLNMSQGVSAAELSNFTRQLATMITAGLPLTDALNLLKAQSNPQMSSVVGTILTDVQSGISLSAAMAKHPKIFNNIYTALVKAGESAGLMEKILNRLADTAEKNREFRGKIIGAMIYPIIILLAMAGVLVVMMVMVIPKMKDLYSDFNSSLPFETRVLIAISDISVHYWWLIILLAAGVFLGVRAIIQTESGQTRWARLVYKFPAIGPLLKQSALAEFTRTMALLLSAGISVVEALKISSDSVGNVVMKREVSTIANQVEKGFPVSISFSEAESFPPIFGQIVAVGEETGKMDEVLAKLSYYFESEADMKVKGLTTAIEPIILIVMAVGVGFLMYAIIMPMYEITNKI
jgi:type II secretory pathway component PulF